MTDWAWEIKVYDVGSDKWISGIDQDLIGPIDVTRSVTENVGEFHFDFDVEDTLISNEDVVILNVGVFGSSISRWFVGRVEQAKQRIDEEDFYYAIEGKGIDKVLLTHDAPETTFGSAQQVDIIKGIVSDIEYDYTSSPTWISNEPIYVEQKDQWQDLCVDEIVSGSWTLTYRGSTQSYGTDYEIDLSGTPYPYGRVKILSDAIRLGDYAYITYQTTRARPFGDLEDGARVYRITTSNVYDENQTLDINVNGFDMLGALQGVTIETTIPYDFWLDTSLDLNTRGRTSGTIHTLSYDTVDELSYYEDSSFIINETLVKQAGGGNYTFTPDPIDSWTEFTSSPSQEYWSTAGATKGVFDLVRFSDTSAQAVTYGGTFLDDWDYTPGISSYTTGVKDGSNYVGTTTATPVYVTKLWREFPSPLNLSNINLRNLFNFYEYGNPSYGTVSAKLLLETDTDNRGEKEWNLDSSFPPDRLVLDGGWTAKGSPDYNNISYLSFMVYSDSKTNMELYIDGAFFGRHPIQATASDSASQALYGLSKSNGIIPYPVIDNTITTQNEAQQRANSIIEMYKDPIPILETVTFTDGRLDLLPGDQLKLETWNSGTYFPTTRIVSVSHHIEDEDMQTTIECKSSSPTGIESYMQELEIEIRRLEMREL